MNPIDFLNFQVLPSDKIAYKRLFKVILVIKLVTKGAYK